MSSAGSATSLFGDARTVLIVDLTLPISHFDGSETPTRPLSDIDYDDLASPFVPLLLFLRAYHVPPEMSVYYVSGMMEAKREITLRRTARFTNICILAVNLDTAEATSRPIFELTNYISSLFPPVVGDKVKALKPFLSLVWLGEGIPQVAGIDLHISTKLAPSTSTPLMMLAKDATHIVQLLTDQFQTGMPLSMVNTRAMVRDLEEIRLGRSAIIEPPWIVELVRKVFTVPNNLTFPNINDENRARLASYINEWDFYAPSLSRIELLHVILLIFERFELLEALEVGREEFLRFILVVEANYRDNPYHNFYHAVDVLQCCYYVLNTSMMMRRMFRHVDVFALFIAALAHDVGHGSFNNNFLVEHEALISWLYNDRSVLENMHAAVLFALLRQPPFNFTSKWNRSTWKEFRQLVVASILGTDMAHHFDYIRQLRGIDGALARSLKNLNNTGEGPVGTDDRRLIAVAIIKFADICNVVRPFASARRWGFHLMCEFYHQGDWEKALGYQSTPMTTRSLGDLAKGQQYFLNNVAAPLYRCVAEYFSELYFVEEHLKMNLEQWRIWRPESDDLVHQYAELYPPTLANISTGVDRSERHHSH